MTNNTSILLLKKKTVVIQNLPPFCEYFHYTETEYSNHIMGRYHTGGLQSISTLQTGHLRGAFCLTLGDIVVVNRGGIVADNIYIFLLLQLAPITRCHPRH